MHPERLSRAFRTLSRRLGIRARLHDLRHSAVTIQLGAGVPLAVVSAVAGHSSTAFTARQYGHLRPDHLREAADAMERAYREGLS
jgi:integrase